MLGVRCPRSQGSPQGGAVKTGKVARGGQAQQKIELQEKPAEDQARQQQFDREKNQLLGSLKGPQGNDGLGLKSAGPTGLAQKGAGPARPAADGRFIEPPRARRAHIDAGRAGVKTAEDPCPAVYTPCLASAFRAFLSFSVLKMMVIFPPFGGLP